MEKFITAIAVFIGVITGTFFLSGAGVGYQGWYALPETISKLVVTTTTLYAFAKMFIFLVTSFLKCLK